MKRCRASGSWQSVYSSSNWSTTTSVAASPSISAGGCGARLQQPGARDAGDLAGLDRRDQAGAQQRGLPAARRSDEREQAPRREPFARPSGARPRARRRTRGRLRRTPAARGRGTASRAGARTRRGRRPHGGSACPRPRGGDGGRGRPASNPAGRCSPVRSAASCDRRISPPLGLPAHARREVHRRAEVVGVAPLGLAGVDPEADRDVPVVRPWLGAERASRGDRRLAPRRMPTRTPRRSRPPRPWT